MAHEHTSRSAGPVPAPGPSPCAALALRRPTTRRRCVSLDAIAMRNVTHTKYIHNIRIYLCNLFCRVCLNDCHTIDRSQRLSTGNRNQRACDSMMPLLPRNVIFELSYVFYSTRSLLREQTLSVEHVGRGRAQEDKRRPDARRRDGRWSCCVVLWFCHTLVGCVCWAMQRSGQHCTSKIIQYGLHSHLHTHTNTLWATLLWANWWIVHEGAYGINEDRWHYTIDIYVRSNRYVMLNSRSWCDRQPAKSFVNDCIQ